MTWFETLTGFAEQSGEQVRSQLVLEDTKLTSEVNDRMMDAGRFTTPTLASLRQEITPPCSDNDTIRIREVVADVQSLHQAPQNKAAVFQVASQFNCLEMAAPHLTPEDGVGIYQYDRTQGPACSICAGAGTIFRNYFAEVNGAQGQTADNQVDCLSEIGRHFNNATNKYWEMTNGYCFPAKAGLAEIEKTLSRCSDEELDRIRGKLKVGIQANTEVTIGSNHHNVTQVFCSALPVAYSPIPAKHWNYFPRLILDSTYEATFSAALRNLNDTGCDKLYLTLVGGGVFGNKLDWILAAIDRSLKLFAATKLDVSIVSYGSSNRQVKSFVTGFDAR